MDTRNDMNRNNPIRFHSTMENDLMDIFRSMTPSQETKSAREFSFERIREVVRSIGDKSQYDLVDINPYSFEGEVYSPETPIECVIVDTENESIPDLGEKYLPIPYDAIKLAHFLSSRGYEGTFVDSAPKLKNRSTILSAGNSIISLPEPTWSMAFENQHSPSKNQYRVLPLVLRITETLSKTPGSSEVQIDTVLGNSPSHEILLHPAHSTNIARHTLLSGAWKSCPATFSLLTRTLWIWLESWGIAELSPSQCAWLVMHFIQQANHDFKDDVTPKSPEELVVRHDDPGLTTPTDERATVPSSYKLGKSDIELDALLRDFFLFVSGLKTRAKKIAFLPLSGTFERRSVKYQGKHVKSVDMKDPSVIKPSKSQDTAAITPRYENLWGDNALVYKDPLVPTHNIMYTVTQNFLSILCSYSGQTVKYLETGHPITGIFGRYSKFNIDRYICGPAFFEENEEKRIERRESDEARLSSFFKIPFVSPQILNSRSLTIQKVQKAIQNAFNGGRASDLRHGLKYRVESFGSTRYGADQNSSDLDLVIIDPERMNGLSSSGSGELPRIYDLRSVSKALYEAGFRIKAVIPSASVPIVKCEDPETGIKCDININEQLGLHNSMLIATYCQLNIYLRPLIVLIKQWAKSHGLNNPSGGPGLQATFSSYALSMMTIGYLQASKLLPNLQEKYALPNKEAMVVQAPDEIGFWTSVKNTTKSGKGKPKSKGMKDRLKIWCDTRFDTPEPPIENQELDNDIMSIRDGGIIPRKHQAPVRLRFEKDHHLMELLESKDVNKVESGENSDKGEGSVKGDMTDADADADLDQDQKQPEIWQLQPLVVTDPFITRKNLAAQISRGAVDRFITECKRAALLIDQVSSFEELKGREEQRMKRFLEIQKEHKKQKQAKAKGKKAKSGKEKTKKGKGKTKSEEGKTKSEGEKTKAD